MFNELCNEDNNFNKIIESIDVLTENGIIPDKVDIAKIWESIKTKIVNAFKKFIGFIKDLVGKIKNFFTQKKLKDAESELVQLKKDYKDLQNKYGKSELDNEPQWS